MTLSCSKKLFALLHGIIFKSHENICINKDFWEIVMLSEKDNILEFNQYMKSDKMPYIIYVDIESLIKKNRWMCKQSRKFFNNKNR